MGGGGDDSFLLLPEVLETDSLDWKIISALTGAGVHQMGTSLASCCCGLQLGWVLEAASCKAKADGQWRGWGAAGLELVFLLIGWPPSPSVSTQGSLR